jgi:hypothetical protein
MKYRPEIDGLRAVAVIPVICFHAGIGLFSGGYVGVDVFFVISGYLITGILQSDLMRGRFSILRFYERRARRILPALFCVMLACIPPALALMLPPQLKDFSQSLVATTLFGSNVLSWMEAGYFAAASELKPLLHTWSLAVEEQYYVIFPLGAAQHRGTGGTQLPGLPVECHVCAKCKLLSGTHARLGTSGWVDVRADQSQSRNATTPGAGCTRLGDDTFRSVCL